LNLAKDSHQAGSGLSIWWRVDLQWLHRQKSSSGSLNRWCPPSKCQEFVWSFCRWHPSRSVWKLCSSHCGRLEHCCGLLRQGSACSYNIPCPPSHCFSSDFLCSMSSAPSAKPGMSQWRLIQAKLSPLKSTSIGWSACLRTLQNGTCCFSQP
jgi:hypothetical protein